MTPPSIRWWNRSPRSESRGIQSEELRSVLGPEICPRAKESERPAEGAYAAPEDVLTGLRWRNIPLVGIANAERRARTKEDPARKRIGTTTSENGVSAAGVLVTVETGVVEGSTAILQRVR